MAADPALLEGLDPYDLMDVEAARIDAYLSALPSDAWSRPTSCSAWNVQQLTAHLAASEEYNRACMTDGLAAFLEAMGQRGVTDMDSFNAAGVSDRAGRTTDELLDEWRAECGETRRWLREHRGGELPTMVGPYSVDWQAFHLANELAVHADDLGVPVASTEAADREAWLSQVARFVVGEADKPVTIEPDGDRYVVSSGTAAATVTPAVLVAAVNGRLPAGALDPQLTSALSFMG